MKNNVELNKVVLYGAGSYGKRMFQRFSENNCTVVAFIDKRAEEVKEFMGIPVVNMEKEEINKIINKNDTVFISVKNVFEHSNIASQLIEKGFHKIIFRPYTVLMGGGNEKQKMLNYIYNLIDENKFENISVIPSSEEEKISDFADASMIEEGENECVANIPWQYVYTNYKRKKGSIWEDINAMQMFPHIAFFSFLLGNSKGNINDYLDFCIKAALQSGIQITESWKANVVKNRTDVFQQMNISYEIDKDFFVRSAPLAEWNDRKCCFNLLSGKHRVAFLLAKGNKFIPLRIKKSEYNLYVRKEAAEDLFGKEIRYEEHRILNPLFLKIPFLNWDFYDNLEKTLTFYISKFFLFPTDTLQWENERLLIALDDVGTVSRHFSRMGGIVTRFIKANPQVVLELDDLLCAGSSIKTISDVSEISKEEYDFVFLDMCFEKKYDINAENMCSKVTKGIFVLGTEEQLETILGGNDVIFEGILNGIAKKLICMKAN